MEKTKLKEITDNRGGVPNGMAVEGFANPECHNSLWLVVV